MTIDGFRFPSIIAAIVLSVAAIMLYGMTKSVSPSLEGSSLTVGSATGENAKLIAQYRWITNNRGVIRTENSVHHDPVLLVESPNAVSVEGYPDISAYLAPAFSQRQNAAQGFLACLIGFVLAAFLFINANTLVRFGLIFAYLGAFATIPLGFNCLSCSATVATENFVPLVALAGFGLTALIFGARQSKARYSAVIFFGVAGSILQGYLLVTSPKLCPWCLLMGLACIGINQAAIGGLIQLTSVTQLTIPRKVSTALMIVLCFAFGRGLLISVNVLKPPPVYKMQFSMLGHRLSEHYSGDSSAGLYMVMSPTCAPCQTAKAFNAENRLHVTEIPVCSGLRTTECFDPGREPVPTPTYFLLNSTGKIVWEFTGVPSTEMQTTFLNRVRS